MSTDAKGQENIEAKTTNILKDDETFQEIMKLTKMLGLDVSDAPNDQNIANMIVNWITGMLGPLGDAMKPFFNGDHDQSMNAIGRLTREVAMEHGATGIKENMRGHFESLIETGELSFPTEDDKAQFFNDMDRLVEESDLINRVERFNGKLEALAKSAGADFSMRADYMPANDEVSYGQSVPLNVDTIKDLGLPDTMRVQSLDKDGNLTLTDQDFDLADLPKDSSIQLVRDKDNVPICAYIGDTQTGYYIALDNPATDGIEGVDMAKLDAHEKLAAEMSEPEPEIAPKIDGPAPGMGMDNAATMNAATPQADLNAPSPQMKL